MSTSSSSSHIFRSLSSESQKKEWSKRLSLRGIRHGGGSNHSRDEAKKHKLFGRSASLKHASAPESTLELAVPGQQSSTQQQPPTMSQQSQQLPTTPKKSNWEVIEHFNTSARGGKAMVSSSLIAAGITRCNIDESMDSTNSSSTCQSPMVYQRDEAQLLQQNFDSTDARQTADGNLNANGGVSPSISFWFRLNRVILRLCSTHQFKNLQVEMLYQRYFLRMNQSNTMHVLGLLLALILALASAHIVFTTLQIRRSLPPTTTTTTATALTTATATTATTLLVLNVTNNHFPANSNSVDLDSSVRGGSTLSAPLPEMGYAPLNGSALASVAHANVVAAAIAEGSGNLALHSNEQFVGQKFSQTSAAAAAVAEAAANAAYVAAAGSAWRPHAVAPHERLKRKHFARMQRKRFKRSR